MIIYCKYTHFSYTLQYCISLHVKNSTKWFIFVYAEYKNFVISVFYCLKIKQHTGSIRNTLEAATRLIPTPPALRDSSMMVGDPGAGLENSSTDRSLCFMDIVPSNLTEWKPRALQTVSELSNTCTVAPVLWHHLWDNDKMAT